MRLVGSPGVEPNSLVLQASAMTALAHFPLFDWIGGTEGNRTPDAQLFRLPLYQLSYRPRHTLALAALAAGKVRDDE